MAAALAILSTLALVQDVGGAAVNTANAFLGDRSRVSQLAINEDGSITVDMIQVGANDAFCCPNMPMTVTFVKAGDQLVYEDLQSATIDATSATTEQVTAFVVPADRVRQHRAAQRPGRAQALHLGHWRRGN